MNWGNLLETLCHAELAKRYLNESLLSLSLMICV